MLQAEASPEVKALLTRSQLGSAPTDRPPSPLASSGTAIALDTPEKERQRLLALQELITRRLAVRNPLSAEPEPPSQSQPPATTTS